MKEKEQQKNRYTVTLHTHTQNLQIMMVKMNAFFGKIQNLSFEMVFSVIDVHLFYQNSYSALVE